MDTNGGNAKLSGYLEKKGKMRMVWTWKKYWFVLEGRLLLYYRSKEEYDARLSPCKGSISLGPPCSVKSYPSMACVFQIEARANTITLRAESSGEQTKWMQAIMSALNQNQSIRTEAPKLSHFRYSLDDLVPKNEPCRTPLAKKLERQNTMPNRLKLQAKNSNEIIQRLQKIGAQSYGGSLTAITKAPSIQEDQAAKSQSQSSLNEPQMRKNHGDNIYERISDDSNKCFIVDNDQYSVPNKRNSSNSIIIENDQYSVPNKRCSSNRESVIIENEQYCSSAPLSPTDDEGEAIYAEPSTDPNKNVTTEDAIYSKVNKVSENEYEDLDGVYSQPIFKNKSSQDNKKKRRKLLNLINNNVSKEDKEEKVTKQDKSLKKSQSFIKRVWKRKIRRRKSKEDESIGEEEEIYEEVDRAAVDKVDVNDGTAVQMLSELQTILETKNAILKRTMSSRSGCKAEGAVHERAENVCPSIPPKTHSKIQPEASPYHDVPRNNKPVDQQEEVRSIDEILEDLDQEPIEPKNKVKMLIDKFNESEEDEVTLRKHRIEKVHRHSDELNRLLNELTKVTNAPIMTPGVTSSLVNPNLTDDEWLRMVPIRQRRLSEPDYDIPRPHKSIHPPKKDQVDAIPATRFFGPVLPAAITENSIKEEESLCISMTPDSLEIEDCQKSQHFSYSSHDYLQCRSSRPTSKDYTGKALKYSSHNHNRDENVIYSSPKPYISTRIVNTSPNIYTSDDENTIIYKNVRNIDFHEEVYNDSLEMCNNNESFTEF